MDSRHVTLTAGTVATVTLDDDYDNVEVVNVDGAAAVYFTVNGDAPTIAGNGTNVLPAAIGGFSEYQPTDQITTVRLISSGTPLIAVRGWS